MIERPPLLGPNELRRWKLLYGVENEALAQSEENTRRRRGK